MAQGSGSRFVSMYNRCYRTRIDGLWMCGGISEKPCDKTGFLPCLPGLASRLIFCLKDQEGILCVDPPN